MSSAEANAKIINSLKQACTQYPDWAELSDALDDQARGLHLAILRQPYLSDVFDGLKTKESRFSVRKVDPFGKIAVGDLVMLKGGLVVGSFIAESVESHQLDNPNVLRRIQREHGEGICADAEFWALQAMKRYATIIGVSDVRPLKPLYVPKNDARGWVVLRPSPSLDEQPQMEFDT